MKIALDAGHGLHTAGKRTPDDIREWTLNNTVLLSFEKEIKKYQGVQVLRLDDPSGQVDIALASRTTKANSWGADYLISFHHNAYQSKWGDHGGTEVWIQNEKSRELANVMLRSTVETLGLRNRGIKIGNLHMNRESNMPSVLVELGFMDSNTDKIIRDKSKRELAGLRMAQAFATHYKLSKVETPSEVVKPKPQAPKPPQTKIVSETGNVFVLGNNVYERNNPSLSDRSGLKLRNKGEKIEYNAYTITDGHNWVRQLNGKWIPWRETNGDKFGHIESKPVAKPAPQPVKNKPRGAWKAEKGVFILNQGVYERDEPNTSDRRGLKLLSSGTRVPYDAYLVQGGYVWLRNSNTGKVIPWRVHNGERWGKIV